MTFDREFRLKNHMKSHDIKAFGCDICSRTFTSKYNLKQHKKFHPANQPLLTNTPLKCKKTSTIHDVFSTYTINPSDNTSCDLTLFLEEARPKIFNVLKEKIETGMGVKWYIIVKVCLSREDLCGGEEIITPFFRSCVSIETNSSEISSNIDKAFAKLNNTFEEFMELGSQWVLDYVIHLDVKMAAYHPLAQK
jgi:hypothetical protein